MNILHLENAIYRFPKLFSIWKMLFFQFSMGGHSVPRVSPWNTIRLLTWHLRGAWVAEKPPATRQDFRLAQTRRKVIMQGGLGFQK